MTCRDVTEILDRYLDGDLPKAARLSLRFHLLLCGHCRNYLRSYKMTIHAAKTAMVNPDGPPPPDMPEELVQAIFTARRRM